MDCWGAQNGERGIRVSPALAMAAGRQMNQPVNFATDRIETPVELAPLLQR